LPIGRIVSVGLTSDASAVEARAWIEPRYRNLVRENSTFWSVSGVDVSFGPISGFEVSADTLETIAAGGVAVATPEPAGQPVATGKRFMLVDEPPEDWTTWRTQLPVGEELLPEGKSLPRPLRATLQWKRKTLGFTRSEQRQGWVLPLAGGKLLGPASLLFPPADAVGAATLEAAGHTWEASADENANGALAIVEAPPQVSENTQAWPMERARVPKAPEDCLVVAHLQSPLPVSTASLSETEGGWSLDASLPINSDWQGAAVVSRTDGAVIGIVLVEKGQATIALVSPAILKTEH
jgi:hypothetical protein